jgi:hypothetical protein
MNIIHLRNRVGNNGVEFVFFMGANKVPHPCSWSEKLACGTLFNKVEIHCHAVHRYRVTLNMIEVGINQGNQSGEVI